MRIQYSGGIARLAALAVAAGIALFAGSAAAQAPADFVPVPLTAAIVQSFIATYPIVKAQTAPIVAKYNITAAAGLDPDTTSLTLNAARSQLNAMASIYGGYADYQTWVNIAMSVAYAMQQATGDKQVDPKIAPLLPTSGPGVIAGPPQVPQVTAGFPASNVDIVKPYAAQLQALLKP